MKENKTRKDLKDMWNAFMCDGAKWSANDIPFCPTIYSGPPKEIITWTEAKRIYRKEIQIDLDFKYDAYVCTYEDDQYFDGNKTGIWANPKNALKIFEHFKGIITPDFSTYQDFPEPLKIYNTFRMRAFGLWIGKYGLDVINNIRWGTEETFEYCFDGVEQDSIVAIGTVGGSPRRLLDRARFENGLSELVKRLHPKTVIVYGSANYSCFEKLQELGIESITYDSRTSKYFLRRKNVKTT